MYYFKIYHHSQLLIKKALLISVTTAVVRVDRVDVAIAVHYYHFSFDEGIISIADNNNDYRLEQHLSNQ